MQECHSKLNQSSWSFSVLLIFYLAWASSTIWVNWKNGYIQSLFDSHRTLERNARDHFLSYTISSDPSLIFGLSLKEEFFFLGPLAFRR